MEAMTRGDRTVRPGWGARHPAMARFVETHEPTATDEGLWPDGLRMQIAAHAGAVAGIPDELVTSVRCVTRVGDGVIVCTTPNDEHIWPGGRREPGETYEQTAMREVREETGWLLDPESFRKLGVLHFEKLRPWDGDLRYPHPDFVQVVFVATASRHETGEPWADTEGWEQSSRIVPLDELSGLQLTAAERFFIDLLCR